MSERRQPWMKWYPADWRADPGLRMCSFAARGLWADVLALMHEGEPYGHLVINGRAPTSRQLAVMLGGTAKEIDALIAELMDAGVPSRTDDGVIYSRRMVRDKAKQAADRANGKGGGNPRLKGPDNHEPKPPDNGGDKPADKGGVNPPANPRVATPVKAQKLEARSQKLEPNEPTTVPDAARATPPTSSDRPDERQSNADAICQRFLELRERGWPAESRLPSPLMTLRTQALAWLDAGGTVDLCNRVMAETVEKKRANGEAAPTNLGFCRLSMDTAILRHLTEIPAAMRVVPEAPEERAYGRALEIWAANGCQGPRPQRQEAGAA